jgi:hypothetical protein
MYKSQTRGFHNKAANQKDGVGGHPVKKGTPSHPKMGHMAVSKAHGGAGFIQGHLAEETTRSAHHRHTSHQSSPGKDTHTGGRVTKGQAQPAKAKARKG